MPLGTVSQQAHARWELKNGSPSTLLMCGHFIQIGSSRKNPHILPDRWHGFLTPPPPTTSTWISKTAWARPPLRISKFKDPPQLTVNTFINDLVFFTGIIFSANESTTIIFNNHEWWSLSKLSSTASLMTQPGTSLRSGRKRQKTGSNRKNITLLHLYFLV